MEVSYQPKKQRFLQKLGLGLLYLGVALFASYALIQYFVLDPRSTTGSFVERKMNEIGFTYRPWIYFLSIHIMGGLLALVLGPFQFSQKLQFMNRKVHRSIGKIYVLSILISGVVGIYLSILASGGIASKVGFFFLDVAWLVTTAIGYLKIRKRDIQRHREWMLRSYAVTLTFVTFRIWSIFAVMISGTYGILYALTIWFSWILNLLVAQLVIRSWHSVSGKV